MSASGPLVPFYLGVIVLKKFLDHIKNQLDFWFLMNVEVNKDYFKTNNINI